MELAKVMTVVSGDTGYDVSHYQTVTDWKALAAKAKFVYIKATEGSEAGSKYTDPKMDSHFKGAKGAGLLTGFYHFARFVSVADAIEEAKWFVKNIKAYDFSLPPCLDLEYFGCSSVSELGKATKAFLDYIEEQLGSAIVYFSREYYKYVKDYVTDYAIWLACPSATINIDKTQDQLFAWQCDWHYRTTGVAGEVDRDLAGGKFFTTRNKMLPAPAPVTPKPTVPTPPPPKPATPTPAPVTVPSTYTVKSGDTLSEIAAKYDLTVDNIKSWNGLSGDTIYVGQVLKLKKPAPAAPAYTNYTIKSGDTLGEIAAAHGTTIAVLKSLNNLKDEDTIYAGEVLKIPVSGGAKVAAPKTIPASYKVQPGDSLSKIASKFGVSQRTLQKLNHISNPDNIIAGQTLRLR